MRTTVIGFVLLQIIVWSIVFSGEENLSENFYENLSDTWQVVNYPEPSQGEIKLHYPTFNRLTLMSDGNFSRLTLDGYQEEGRWRINEANTHLILDKGKTLEKYEIIQLPDEMNNVFVIKEQVNQNSNQRDLEVKLTRL